MNLLREDRDKEGNENARGGPEGVAKDLAQLKGNELEEFCFSKWAFNM